MSLITLRPQGEWRGVIDLRRVTDDPLTAQYLSHRAMPVLEVPLQFCRGLQPVGFDFSESHPFVKTARVLREREAEYATSPLAEYYRSFQPRSAREVLGLPCETTTARLEALQPSATVLPWWSDWILERLRNQEVRDSTMKGEYKKAGMRLTGEDHGGTLFGPMPEDQGALEIRRIRSLVHSISAQGLLRNDLPDGDITGCFLIDDQGDFRVMLHSGQHRAAVAAALGYVSVPVRVFSPVSASLVRRGEGEHWPHVRSGLYSVADALRVFDRIFAGVPASDPSVRTEMVAREQ